MNQQRQRVKFQELQMVRTTGLDAQTIVALVNRLIAPHGELTYLPSQYVRISIEEEAGLEDITPCPGLK